MDISSASHDWTRFMNSYSLVRTSHKRTSLVLYIADENILADDCVPLGCS